MLLRYLTLFLNILVVVSKLTPGWTKEENGPKRGGLYWIATGRLAPRIRDTHRIACIVLEARWAIDNSYFVRVVIILRDLSKTSNEGFPATDFFEHDTIVEMRSGPSRLTKYDRIHTNTIYQTSGDWDDIAVYNGDPVKCVTEDGMGRLLVASGMVDGWDEDEGQLGPLLGAVYWVHPGIFGPKFKAKSGVYIPCVVIRWVGNGNYRVAVMSTAERQNGYRVTEFFGNVNLYTGIPKVGLNHLNDHYIYPHKKYEIKADPTTMRRWRNVHLLLQIPQDGLHRLVAVSGMVDGTDDLTTRGGIYWLQPQLLGMHTKVGLYIPCVLIHRVGNEYRIVWMTLLKGENGRDATEFFQSDAKLQTPLGLTNFQDYYFHPEDSFVVRGNVRIMQRWEEGTVTIMAENNVKKLEQFVSTRHPHRTLPGHK